MSATGSITRCSRALSYEGTKRGTGEDVRTCDEPAAVIALSYPSKREYGLCEKHLAEGIGFDGIVRPA